MVSPAWKTAIPTGQPISSTIGPFLNSGAMCFRSAARISAKIHRWSQRPQYWGCRLRPASPQYRPSQRGVSPRRQVFGHNRIFQRRRNTRSLSLYPGGHPCIRQCERRSAKWRIHRQCLVVARSEHRPHSSVHGIYAFQWRRHELRWGGTECQFQQHSLFTRAIRFLGCSENNRRFLVFDSRFQSAGRARCATHRTRPLRFVMELQVLA